jgi:hypothetical protein
MEKLKMKKLNIFKRLYYKTKIRLYNFFKYRNNNICFKLEDLYSKEKDVYLELNNIPKEQELTLEQLKYSIKQYNMVKNYMNSKQYKKDSEKLKMIRGY